MCIRDRCLRALKIIGRCNYVVVDSWSLESLNRVFFRRPVYSYVYRGLCMKPPYISRYYCISPPCKHAYMGSLCLYMDQIYKEGYYNKNLILIFKFQSLRLPIFSPHLRSAPGYASFLPLPVHFRCQSPKQSHGENNWSHICSLQFFNTEWSNFEKQSTKFFKEYPSRTM